MMSRRSKLEPAGIRTTSPPPRRDTPTNATSKVETFFNCVAGSILMTWCEWLGGNVTSGI